eukprot:c24742_g1_i1 orf=505-2664(-)
MQKRSRRSKWAWRILGIGSLPGKSRWYHLCSFVSVAWLAGVMLNLRIIYSDGQQDSYSNANLRSGSSLKELEKVRNDGQGSSSGKKAASFETNGRSEVEFTSLANGMSENVALEETELTAVNDCESEKKELFRYTCHSIPPSLSARTLQCKSSSKDALLNLFFPVCNVESPLRSRRKSLPFGSPTTTDSSDVKQGLRDSTCSGVGFSDHVIPTLLDGSETALLQDLNSPDELSGGSSSDQKIINSHPEPPVDEITSQLNGIASDGGRTGSMVEGQQVVTSPLNERNDAVTSAADKIRQEPGLGPYNFASDSKGAKILGNNKDTKGASNILNKDKDKYLRNPCSVENKFVDIELSEETLVVTVVIANYEFYSSNLREFEILGSLDYPTDAWVSLGKFHAENVKVSQKFTLSEPKWVRYLRLQMISHYGSEFYCTLSAVEVYGVDAMELLLQDWIAEEAMSSTSGHPTIGEEMSWKPKPGSNSLLPSHLMDKEESNSMLLKPGAEDFSSEAHRDMLESRGRTVNHIGRQEGGKSNNLDKAHQPIQIQGGRSGLDAVMKLLMQKVKSLEHSQLSINQYLEDQNQKNKVSFRGFGGELSAITEKLHDTRTLITGLTEQLLDMERQREDYKVALETSLSDQLKRLNADFELLRSEVVKLENREMVALLVALFYIIFMVVLHGLRNCFSLLGVSRMERGMMSMCSLFSFLFYFLSCCLVVFVILQ